MEPLLSTTRKKKKKQKQNYSLVFTLRFKKKNRKKILLQVKDSSPNKSGGELGQVIWVLVSKLFGGHPNTHIPQTNLLVNKDLHT